MLLIKHLLLIKKNEKIQQVKVLLLSHYYYKVDDEIKKGVSADILLCREAGDVVVLRVLDCVIGLKKLVYLINYCTTLKVKYPHFHRLNLPPHDSMATTHRGEAEAWHGETVCGGRVSVCGRGRGLQRVLQAGGAQIAVRLAVGCSNKRRAASACDHTECTGALMSTEINTHTHLMCETHDKESVTPSDGANGRITPL